MAALSIDASSPVSHLSKESPGIPMAGASLLFSPSSEKRFWSALRSRVDTLLENRQSHFPSPAFPQSNDGGGSNRAKRMKEDAMLLLRGFDSVAFSLSQLSSNLDNALQGARELAKLPALNEVSERTSDVEKASRKLQQSNNAEGNEQERKGMKRKFEVQDSSNDLEEHPVEKENELNQANSKLKKAKNMAMSVATKAAVMARELKSIKMDLSFMQERCALLEEENQTLRDGFAKGIRPEEDDLVRLQLEALLAEKSRLANENANLTRENQCLRQLVEYHEFTSQDLSASYEHLLQGICLDFSSPLPYTEENENAENGDDAARDLEHPPHASRDILELSASP
ncbi:hypothetical protein Ancab_021530 [Ancistrocladus abbreviatus]